jgi:hypothetical protein
MMVSYITAVKAITGGRIGGLNDGPLVNLKFYDGQSPPSEEQIQAKIAELQAAEPLRLLRQQRNQLLTETDWRMVSDYPGANQTEWQTYRQALRNITTQTPSLDSNGNLTGITWPTPPND